MVHFIRDIVQSTERNPPKDRPPRKYQISDPPYNGFQPIDTTTYQASSVDLAIVIDNGSSAVRAGWQIDATPRLNIPPLMARYTDRKLNRKLTFVGSEVYFDGTARGQAKNVYEVGNNIINNWDVKEGLLDYIFVKLGVQSEGRVDRPVLLTEPAANLEYSRKVMNELMFELYDVPSVGYAVDSLLSFKYNGGTTGLVVSAGHTATNVIPVINSQPVFKHATRLDWGRQSCAEHLAKLLRIKYPMLPSKINDTQIEDLVQRYCHVSQNFDADMLSYLDWSGLEDRDVIIQMPFTEKEVVQKTEEELLRAAEKRKEGGRRLQEQAAKMRLEKLIRKEQELEYYRDLQQRVAAATTKKDARVMLEADDFDDPVKLDKKIKEMEKSIRKQRNKDVGDLDEPEEVPTYPLLDTPDDQLDEEGLKQKRQQRLNKAGYDARARAKAEKAREKARVLEEAQLDDQRRESDLDGWLEERRAARLALLQRIKDRDRLKADLGNRKSTASQMRMKQIANLASDTPNKKRRRGGDDDNFGADDADWGVYRSIVVGENAGSDDEEEDFGASLKEVEGQLLKYDQDFTEQNTQDAQQDWTKSLAHRFLRGAYPYDPDSTEQNNQFHLNVERIRVPEVIFCPSMAGVDQRGVVEIVEDIIQQRLAGETSSRDDMLKDIFTTGGYTMFQGFQERLDQELRAVLPADSFVRIRRAKDPLLDAWKGAAQWAAERESRKNFFTRQEYNEKGSDYLKEHHLGNGYM